MAIPKVIHYCWFGKSEMPDEFKGYIETWKKFCPDYEIKLWDESNYDIGKDSYMQEAYEHKKWGFVSDYARLDIIYNEGGIYLDTDVEIVRSLDELLENEAFCGIETGSPNVASGLGFGAEKGHPIIKRMLDEYKGLSIVDEEGNLNLILCPELNTRPLLEMGYAPSEEIQTLYYEGSSITVYPGVYFCPKDFATRNLALDKRSFSIHHYAATWFSKQEKDYYEKRVEMVSRYGKEAADKHFARLNKKWRAMYYMQHPMLGLKKILEKTR